MAKMSKLFAQHKKTLFFVIGLGLILAFLPWQSVEANPWIKIGEEKFDLLPGCGPLPQQWPRCIVGIINFFFLFPVKLMAGIIVLGLFLVALFFGVLFFLLGGTLVTVIEQTLSIKVVPGAGTDVVTVGWQFSRDFANMFLILILAVIGLATILKLKEYETKKMLPMLLIVALLINFSGVLVGFVVDIGNLVTNFFIQRFAGFSLNHLKDTWNLPLNYLKEAFLMIFAPKVTEDTEVKRDPFADPLTQWGGIIGSIVYGLVVLFFFVAGFCILLMVMLIFFLRVIVLWVLTILAPIAFLSRALPATPTVKRLFPGILHWDAWWQTLIQWSIIGIPQGLFLVLSRGVLMGDLGLGGLEAPEIATSTLPAEMTTSTLSAEEFIGWFANFTNFIPLIFAPTVGLILMGLGSFISMKTAPSMAQGIMSWGKTTGKAIGVSTLTRATAWGRERIVKSEGAQKIAQTLAMAPTPGTGVPGARGVLIRTTAGPIWASLRAMGRAVGPGLIEAERREIEAREKKVAGKRVEAQLAAYRSARTEAERIGILTAMIKDRNIDAAMDATKFGKGAITEDEIKRLYKVAQKYDKHGVMIAAFPHITRTPALLPTSQLPPGTSPAQFIFDRISPANYEYLSKQALQDKEFLEAMLRKGTGEHVAAFSRRFGEKGASALEERLKELATQKGTTPEGWLRQAGNIRLLQYLTRGAGVGLIHIPSSPPPGQPPGRGWTWTGRLWQPPPQPPRRPPP